MGDEMKERSAKAEAARILRDLSIAEVTPDWQGCDPVWGALERMRDDGAVVLVKLDGERAGEGDNGPYTVAISGGRLEADDFFRIDTFVLEEALAHGIIHYARKCWLTD